MNGLVSRRCEPSGEHSDVCDEYPSFGGSDSSLEVLCQHSASPEPREGSLHDPPARQDFEAFGLVRALDDFQRELSDLLQCAPQLRPGIAAIGEDMAQPRPRFENGLQDSWRAVAVLNVGGMDDEPDQQAERVNDDVALAAHDLLAGIKTPDSAAFGGLDRLASMTPAVGLACLPSRSRAAMTSSLLMVRSRPSSRQRQKYFCTVENGGKSIGKSRHAPPDEHIYNSAFTTSRRFVLRGRPMRFGEGICGTISAHSASVRSLA